MVMVEGSLEHRLLLCRGLNMGMGQDEAVPELVNELILSTTLIQSCMRHGAGPASISRQQTFLGYTCRRVH